MKKLLALLTAALLSQVLTAQDVHFSQYSNAPLVLNPGLTGLFNGEYRLSTSHRIQWASLDVPFVTNAVAFDTRFFTKSSSSLGVGIMAYHDKAGNNNLSTTDISLNLSGIISVNKHQLVSLGLSGGLLEKGLDPSGLKWESQYVNGAFDPANPSGEVIDLEPALTGNFSLGLAWRYFSRERYITSNDQIKADAGIAYHHVNRPQIKFFADGTDRLHSKLVVHGTAQIGITNTTLAIVPGGFYAQQGASREILAGASLRATLQEESKYTGLVKGMAVSAGCHYRVGDAVVTSVLIELSNLRLGFSYDVTVSKLREANSRQGGPEFSITYITPNPFTYKGKYRTRSYI